MKIAILTLGTRGDVQPYAVLGRALQDRGHQVTLSTARNFGGLVASYGLDFVPVEADFQSLITSEEGSKIRKNPFLAKKQLAKFVYPMMADAFRTFYRLSQENDKVLFHIKTMADSFADQFPGKMIRADVIPASQVTRAFSNPVFSAFSLPAFLNRFTYKITEWGLKMWTKPVSDFRRSVGLPLPFSKPDLPSLYGISEIFLPKPDDYPKNSWYTGFWNAGPGQEADAETLRFLDAGEAPLLITFGSMPFDSKVDLGALVRAVTERLGLRVILIRGWGLKDTSALEANPMIHVLDSAPYDKIFPRVKAVVHHGGIGTIAACLEAGKPFLTCPVLYPLGDQVFWGKVAVERGVGLPPQPLKKLDEGRFLAAVRELVSKETLHTNAALMGQRLRAEDGLGKAISLVEEL